MPEYRQGTVRGGQQFAGVSRYLNLKRVFEDAKRQQQWDLQKESMQQRGQRTQQATQMATYGVLPGADLNKFVESGQFPENFQGQGIGNQGGLVYRDALSGQEVPEEQAMQDIQGGSQKYIVSKIVNTRSGPRENVLIKPPDLSGTEKEYVIGSRRIQTRLNNMLNRAIPKLESGKWGGFQSIQTQRPVPYFAVKDKDLQDFKSNLNAVKADIPFLRGGKQLTNTEAKRVDILLDPFGKDTAVLKRDYDTFLDEFIYGENLMKYGVAGEKQFSGGGVLTATNPQTGQRIQSKDGGKTWQPMQ